MSRSERRAQRNKIKTDPQSDDELGEFQTLESAERQRYEWWGAISKDKDFNGLHHSSKNLDFLHFFGSNVARSSKNLSRCGSRDLTCNMKNFR